MSRRFVAVALAATFAAGAVTLATAGQADAEPVAQQEDKVCFYDKTNYTGESFCTNCNGAVDNMGKIPMSDGTIRKFQNKASSVKLIGRCKVTVWGDPKFKGMPLTMQRNEPRLSKVLLSDGRQVDMNNVISSYKTHY